jgi:hypothetical protein
MSSDDLDRIVGVTIESFELKIFLLYLSFVGAQAPLRRSESRSTTRIWRMHVTTSSRCRKNDSTYGVFVEHRRARLVLRRGFATLEEANAFLSEVRALRFHDPERVFIARERDGAVVSKAGDDGAIEPASSRPALHAVAMADALRSLGPTNREHVIGMLVALGLSPRDADAVLRYAFVHMLLAIDSENPDRIRAMRAPDP